MAVTMPSFFMDIGMKNAYSAIGHFADGNPTVFLECCDEMGTHKQILFRSVRFGADSTEMRPGEVE
jgi:hypothetical protein